MRTLFDLKDIPLDLRQYFEEVEVTCGAQWAPVVERENMVIKRSGRAESANVRIMSSGTMESPATSKVLAFRPTCSCPPHEPVSATVLDPFSGGATTGLAASRLGRSYIGIELSEAYMALARARLSADAPMLAGDV